MRSWATLLAVSTIVLAQSAQQGKQMRRAFELLVKAGNIEQANLVMSEGYMQWLSQEPEEASAVCKGAARYVRKSANKKRAEWQDLVAKLIKVGEWTVGGNDKDGNAYAAHAEALLCRARLNDDPTMADNAADDWTAAAELYVKADGVEPEKGKFMEQAVRILREGTATGRANAADLQKRAAALVEQGSKRYPSNEFFREIRHKAMLDKIRDTIEEDRREGKKMMEAYLQELQPSLASPGDFSPTFYNDAVTLEHQLKLGLKVKYKTVEHLYGSRYLSFQVPEGKRWKWKGSRLRQYDLDGELIRSFNFYTYKWTTLYYVGSKEFGGDNIKGLARIGEHDVLKNVVRKVTKRKNLRRKKLNRYCPHSQALTIGGIDEEGDYVCFHLYYFKAKKTKLLTLHVSIVEWADIKKFDPEAKFVLDSIREP